MKGLRAFRACLSPQSWPRKCFLSPQWQRDWFHNLFQFSSMESMSSVSCRKFCWWELRAKIWPHRFVDKHFTCGLCCIHQQILVESQYCRPASTASVPQRAGSTGSLHTSGTVGTILALLILLTGNSRVFGIHSMSALDIVATRDNSLWCRMKPGQWGLGFMVMVKVWNTTEMGGAPSHPLNLLQ